MLYLVALQSDDGALRKHGVVTTLVKLPDDYYMRADINEAGHYAKFERLKELCYKQCHNSFSPEFAMLKPEYRESTKVVEISKLY